MYRSPYQATIISLYASAILPVAQLACDGGSVMSPLLEFQKKKTLYLLCLYVLVFLRYHRLGTADSHRLSSCVLLPFSPRALARGQWPPNPILDLYHHFHPHYYPVNPILVLLLLFYSILLFLTTPILDS